MHELNQSKAVSPLRMFPKETLIKGQPAQQECVEINGQVYSIARGPVTLLGLEDEWYEDVHDPAAVIETLRNSRGFKPDLFTFWQRLPVLEPKFAYPHEWEEIAVLPIKSYEHWWNKQIKGTTRNMIRKSQKAGVEVRECTYNDDFIRGMTAIFNEAPVRQGRRFWHYGKDFETVKRQFSRYLFREELIGAYLGADLVGFVMMGNAGKYGDIGQIISKLEHRDKAITNALIAKTIAICEQKRLPYLVYAYWSQNSLSDFKRHSGFECLKLPRYFVPLTPKGQLALKLGAHRGWKTLLPDGLKSALRQLRSRWYSMRATEKTKKQE